MILVCFLRRTIRSFFVFSDDVFLSVLLSNKDSGNVNKDFKPGTIPNRYHLKKKKLVKIRES